MFTHKKNKKRYLQNTQSTPVVRGFKSVFLYYTYNWSETRELKKAISQFSASGAHMALCFLALVIFFVFYVTAETRESHSSQHAGYHGTISPSHSAHTTAHLLEECSEPLHKWVAPAWGSPWHTPQCWLPHFGDTFFTKVKLSAVQSLLSYCPKGCTY